MTLPHRIPLAKPQIIAIDGPVATGKSVVGRLLAEGLGFRFVDTGMMYRAVTWLALDQGLDMNDEASLTSLAASSTIRVEKGEDKVLINGRLVPLQGRRAEIEKWVSLVSRVPGVREALLKQQQQMLKEGKIVMVGRDVGTVVAPNAPLKWYFRASLHERAKRRYHELQAQGSSVQLEQVQREMAARDKLDSERAYSPLKPAEDARFIDTEGLTVEQVVDKNLKMIELS